MSYTLVLEWMPGDLYMSAVTARCTAPTSSYSVVWLPPNKVYQITLYCGSTSLVSFLVGAFRGKAWSYMTNEELSFRTKQALAAALKTALERKKLSKITVSELAEACQVNRKTFYYHFQDVYALFRWMLEQEAIDVVKNFDLVVDTEEALRFVMEYVDENKHLINGAFDSMGYEEIKRFFYNDLFSVLDGAISQGETELGVRLDPGFKKYLATFYTEASAGLLMEWIKSRDAYDKETVLENLLSIFKISMMAIISQKGCSEK